MDVASSCPLRVASLVWQPRPGTWVLTVVAKATIVLRPGECTLAAAQLPPAEDDIHVDDDPARSVRIPRDLVPVKPSVDVVLIGSAFAPEKRHVRSLLARLAIGEVDKSVEVLADSARRSDGAVREGPPFTQMSLAWERAAGGAANPVGVHPDARDAEGHVRLPNLRRPGAPPAGAFDPISFGPIAPWWSERRVRLTGAAAGWSFRDLAERPLPEGMDLGFFNAAPQDQRLRALDERQRITLENLHRDHATLVTTLPALSPRAMLEGRRAGPQPIVLRADTLLIDTDRGIAAITYRGMVPLEAASEAGRVVVSVEGATREAPAPPNVARRLEMTADIPLGIRLAAALPFAQQAPAPNAAALPFAQQAPAPNVAAPPPSAPSIAATPPAPSPWAHHAPLTGAPASAPIIVPMITLAPIAAVSSAPPAVTARDLSDAAVRAHTAPRSEPVPLRVPAPADPAPSAPRVEPASALELIWFDPECVPRARRKAAWRPLLDALERAPLDPEFDDPAFAADPTIIEDRREIFAILARADAVDAEGLADVFQHCHRDDTRFVPALALFTGELEMPFDELAALRATVTTASPLAGQDDALKGALQAAKDFLAMPGLMSAPAVAEALTKRVDDAFTQGKRVVPPGYLEAQRERALLEQRQYQRRAVFGGKHLRAVLKLGGGDATATDKPKPASTAAAPLVPAYLPERLAEDLPMFPRFRARLIAEVRLAADRYEAHPAALRVLALARIAAPPKGDAPTRDR